MGAKRKLNEAGNCKRKRLMPYVTGIIVISWMALNCMGFCFNQMRFVSDEEKIKTAITFILKEHWTVHSNGNWQIPPGEDYGKGRWELRGLPARPLPYKNVDDFLKKNPNCCNLTYELKTTLYEGSSYRVGLFDLILGTKTSIVVVRYVFKFVDEKGELKEKKVLWYSGIDNCCGFINVV